MNVASLLSAKGADVETIRPDTPISTVVRQLRLKGVGALVISEDGRTIQGLIAERHSDHAIALVEITGILRCNHFRIGQSWYPVFRRTSAENFVRRDDRL